MYLYLIAEIALAAATAFGLTYLLLRKTTLAPYTPILAVASFQPLMLLAVTRLGYRVPDPLTRAPVLSVVGAGFVVTIAVGVRYRREIVDTLRRGRATAVLATVLVAVMVSLTTPIVGWSRLAYIDWWNGELVNYSYFAHGFLGLLSDKNYIPGFQSNMTLRYGAELFLATMSALFQKPPLMLVEMLSAFHKVTAVMVFAAMCHVVGVERGVSRRATALASAGFALATILSLNYVLAFLAAQAVTASVILISLSPFALAIRERRVQMFLAIHVAFVVMTYGEALPFLCAVGGVLGLEAIFARRIATTLGIVVTFAVGFLINPVLLVERLGYMYRLRLVVAGFNVLGSPQDGLVPYLAGVFGLRYPFADITPLPQPLLEAGVIAAVVLVAAALCYAAWRLRTTWFLLLPLLLLAMHLSHGIEPPSSAYYKTYKALAALYFFGFFALAFLMDVLLSPRRRSAIARVGGNLLMGGGLVWFGGSVVVNARATDFIRHVPSIYWEDDVDTALRRARRDGGPVSILARDNSAALWDLLLGYARQPRILLDATQAKVVYHNNAPVPTEPVVIGPSAGAVTPRSLFTGTVIEPRVFAYSPGPKFLDIRVVLDDASPGVRFRGDGDAYERSAFRLESGAVVDTGNAGAAADGRANLPPAVVRVTPMQGAGSNALLTFEYRDPNGYADVAAALINIGGGQGTTPSCYLSYNRVANQLGLVQDGGKTWDVATIGTSKVMENSLCRIMLASTRIAGSGEDLFLTLTLTFKPAFSGVRIIETTVADDGKLTTGWQPVGTWTVR